MAYNESSPIFLGDLKALAQRTKSQLGAVSTIAASAIKSVVASGNTVNFYTSADGTGTAAFSFDFPSELFLDGLRTSFVPSFAFNSQTYPGATNPSLEGKPVLVLAVKNTTNPASGTVNDTVNYSFIDMSALVDTYTVKAGDSSKIITIAGYQVEVHISSAANNAISVQNDGLYVDTSDKADKVDRAEAAAAHNPYDETTQAEQYAAFNTAYALTDHIVTLDANGNIKDSGVKFATRAEVTEMLDEVFGAA